MSEYNLTLFQVYYMNCNNYTLSERDQNTCFWKFWLFVERGLLNGVTEAAPECSESPETGDGAVDVRYKYNLHKFAATNKWMKEWKICAFYTWKKSIQCIDKNSLQRQQKGICEVFVKGSTITFTLTWSRSQQQQTICADIFFFVEQKLERKNYSRPLHLASINTFGPMQHSWKPATF